MTPDDCSSGIIPFIVSGNASQSRIIALRGAELVCSLILWEYNIRLQGAALVAVRPPQIYSMIRLRTATRAAPCIRI